MEPGTGASVRQRVSGGTARLSRNSSLALSPLSPSARVAEQVPPAASVLICRCPKGAGAWENLGVLITLGVQPLCQLCQGYARQCLCGDCGDPSLVCWAGIRGSLVLGMDCQRWEQ